MDELSKILDECEPILTKSFERFKAEVLERFKSVDESPKPAPNNRRDEICHCCDGIGTVPYINQETGRAYTCTSCGGTGKLRPTL